MRISDWSSDVCSSDLLIGAKREAIRMAEDRELFRVAMGEIGLECPKAEIARTFEQALEKQAKVGYPTVIRPDRKSVVEGKSVSVRVDLGGRRILKKKK